MTTAPPFGAWIVGPGRVRHRVWAPEAASVTVVRTSEGPVPLVREPSGHWSATVDGEPGDRYDVQIDGGDTSTRPGLDGPA